MKKISISIIVIVAVFFALYFGIAGTLIGVFIPNQELKAELIHGPRCFVGGASVEMTSSCATVCGVYECGLGGDYMCDCGDGKCWNGKRCVEDTETQALEGLKSTCESANLDFSYSARVCLGDPFGEPGCECGTGKCWNSLLAECVS